MGGQAELSSLPISTDNKRFTHPHLIFIMVEEIRKQFRHLLNMVDGLTAIIVSDRDGIPVLKVCEPATPENPMRPKLLSTFSMATEQASKLGLGANRSLVALYGAHQVVCVNHLPLIVTLIATSEANTGHIMSVAEEMKDTVAEIKQALIVTPS